MVELGYKPWKNGEKTMHEDVVKMYVDELIENAKKPEKPPKTTYFKRVEI